MRRRSARGLGTRIWPSWASAACCLGGLLLAILLHVLRNTRQKAADRERRSLSPSQMSAGAQTQEIDDNLATGREVAAAGRVTPEVQKEIAAAVEELEAKRQAQQLEIVAFGTISSGKSSLLNALAGRQMFRTNVVGGTTVTRSEIPWPAGDRVVLVDTPGLAEVRGESRAAEAAAAAKNADLVLFVVDGPLKSYESELLEALAAMEKRIVVCLNKEDWYDAEQRDELVQQLVEQVSPAVNGADVVAVRSRPTKRRRVHVLSDGSEQDEEVDGRAGCQSACAADDGDCRARRARAAAGEFAAAVAGAGGRSQGARAGDAR